MGRSPYGNDGDAEFLQQLGVFLLRTQSRQFPSYNGLHAVTSLLWVHMHTVMQSHLPHNVLHLHAQSGSYEAPILSYSYI